MKNIKINWKTIRRSINRPEGCHTCQDFTPGIDLKILWGTGNNFEGQANFQQNFLKQGINHGICSHPRKLRALRIFLTLNILNPKNFPNLSKFSNPKNFPHPEKLLLLKSFKTLKITNP